MRRGIGTAVAAALLATFAAGCASAQARGAAVGPALDTPPPPPHVVQEPGDPDPPARPDDAGPGKAPRTPPPAVPAKAAGAEPATPAKPADPPLPPLQTTANVAEMEKKVRAMVDRAVRDLDRIDYRALGADRKQEYDTARRFVRQAEDALEVKNIVFAEQLAEKAVTLAARLVARSTATVTGATTPA